MSWFFEILFVLVLPLLRLRQEKETEEQKTIQRRDLQNEREKKRDNRGRLFDPSSYSSNTKTRALPRQNNLSFFKS